MIEHYEPADVLRDKDALRATLPKLTHRELGAVLALVLAHLNEPGVRRLSVLLRGFADQVEAMEEEEGVT